MGVILFFLSQHNSINKNLSIKIWSIELIWRIFSREKNLSTQEILAVLEESEPEDPVDVIGIDEDLLFLNLIVFN